MRWGGVRCTGRESKTWLPRRVSGRPSAPVQRTSAPYGVSRTSWAVARRSRAAGRAASRECTSCSKRADRTMRYRSGAGADSTVVPSAPRTRRRVQEATTASSNAPGPASQ